MLLELQGGFMADPARKGHITEIMQCLLNLWDRELGSATAADSTSVPIADLPEDDAAWDTIRKQEQLACYPNWPLLYTRPRYEGLEYASGRSQDTSVYTKCDGTENKESPGQRKFNPGIFKVTCVHGIVYGFHFLKDDESPNDLFTLLLTRFPHDKRPALVFYDNACKLYEYILNREPWLLKDMRVLVDSFHYGGWRARGMLGTNVPIHKCPNSFDTKEHVVGKEFNTQYEEHSNAYISLHKGMARTMRLQRARELASVLLRFLNGRKLDTVSRRKAAITSKYNSALQALGRLAG